MEEVNQKVWHIEIRKLNVESSYQKNGIFISEHKIIGISRYKICINDDFFSTFSIIEEGKRKENYYNYLNDIKCSIRINNHLLGDGITINLYSTKKPTKATINKMVATCCSKIDKDYGWLFRSAKEELYSMSDNFKI